MAKMKLKLNVSAAVVGGLMLMTTSSWAATVGTIADQTVSAGSDFSFNVSVSGGTINTSATLSRGRYEPFSPGSCNVTAMNNAGVETVPGATISLPFNFSGGTVSWPREHNTYQTGPHCFRLRACDRFPPFACDNEYFHVNVTQDGIIHYPIYFTHRDRIVVANDPEPPRHKVGAWAMRMSQSTPEEDLLRLDSCPSGYSCSPPALPSWVTLDATPADGLEFVFDIPSGPSGEFVFTPKIPRLPREVEGNDTFLVSNVLSTVGSTRAAISPSSDVDFYKFYAEAGDTFTIRTATSSTNSLSCSTTVDTYMRLFSDDGSTQLTANDASSTNQCSRIIYTASSSQWFYVSVEEHGQNATISNYYMWLSGTDDATDATFSLHTLPSEEVTPPQVVADESLKHFPELEAKNDLNDTAPSIQGSGVVSGALDPANDIDRFRFVVGEKTVHTFSVSNQSLGCDFDAVLRIYRRSETGTLTQVIESNDFGGSTCPEIPYLELERGHYLVTIEEDGRNSPVYHYLLEHRTNPIEVEPANNSTLTAWFINPIGFAENQAELFNGNATDYFQQLGNLAPAVWGEVGGPGDTVDYYSVPPGDTVYAETSDGAGGCPGDTNFRLYRYSVPFTNPSEGGGSLITVANDDDSGPGLCSRINYTVPVAFQNHVHVLRITRDGGGTVGPYLLRFGADTPTALAGPDWHEPGFGQAQTFGYDDGNNSDAFDVLSVTYGGYYNAYARYLSGYGGDHVSVYDQSGISSDNCENPVNLYLFISAELRDGDGVCREFTGEKTTTQTSTGWRKTRTVAGSMFSYSPSSSEIGNRVGRTMFGSLKTGNTGANRYDDDNEASGRLSAIELDVVSGDNSLETSHYNQCDGGIPGVNTSACSMNVEFHEGEYFTFPFFRPNRLTTMELRRCLSAADVVCNQSLLGATYSTSADEIRWTIPYTTTSSVRDIYFRVRSIGNAGRGEDTDSYHVRVRVRHRASGSSGADLAFRRVVEIHPGAYSTIKPNVNFNAIKTSFIGGGVLYDVRTLYRSAYGSANYRTRSLGSLDRIYLHPLFEMGELGDANGQARLEATITNRGTSTSASTYVDAIQMPAVFDSNGNYAGGTPNGTEASFDSYFISSIGAGSSRNAYLDLPTHRLQPQAGALPWEGGPVAIVFLRIRSGGTNSIEGPFQIVAPERGPIGICFLCIAVPELSGGISNVSPAIPTEGQSVGVSFTETYQGTWGNNQATHRFYLDETAPPSAATPFHSSVNGPSSPQGGVTYGGTFTFSAVKPDNATNEVPVRILLNANGAADEPTQSNNHLPSFSAPYLLEIANSAPAFVSAPTTLSATEGQTLVRTWTVTDQNAVDRPRLTFSQIAGPAMSVTSSIAPCGGNNYCATTSFTPSDAQAASTPLVATFRVCDGDPVAGGLGECTNHNVTLNITRLNDAPVFTSSTGPTNATENVAYSHQVTATDEETPGSLTFSLISRPSGMSIHPTTGVITWTPTDVNVPSSNFVRVRVFDVAPSGTSGASFRDQTWSISVANVNDRPAIASFSPTNGTEGFSFTSHAVVTDADPDIAGVSQTISCSLIGAPPFLSSSIVNIGRTRYCRITGVPNDPDTGPLSFTVRVSDGIQTASRGVTITIANQNEAPFFTSSPGFVNGTQGAPFAITLFAADPDLNSPVANESLSFTQLSGPTASLSPAADRVTVQWTPGPADAGTTPVITIRVRDAAGLTDTVDVRFNPITNANDAPYFSPPPPNLAFTEGDVVVAQVNASDPDLDAGFNEVLTYSIVGGAPPGLGIEPADGSLFLTTPQGRADDDQVGLWTVTVRVQDDNSPTPAFVETDFDLDIANVNDAPVISSTAPATHAEDTAFTYSPTVVDPDFPETQAWSSTGLPAWMTQAPTTGVLTSLGGRPNNADVGTHAFTITVTDGEGAADTQAISLTVTNENDTPVVTSVALTAATQDVGYSYAFTASDDDIVHGDQLTYSAPTLPGWLNFNSSTRLLSGVPTNANVGNHAVILRVQDDAGAFATQPFTIVVANVNDAPILTPIGSRQVAESATLSFAVSAVDPDGTTPTITVSPATLPSGATFNGTTFAWTPDFGDAGNYTVRFIASDTVLTDFEDVIITVGDVNRPPVLALIGPQAVDENASLSFTVTASDPDTGDTLTLSAVADPPEANPLTNGATFNPGSGLFTWSPDFDAAGTYRLRFSVSDSELEDVEVVTFVVNNQNRAPAFSTSAVLAANEDAPYSYPALAPDPDGDAVTYALTTRPTGMNVDANSGSVTWVPTNAQVGAHSVVLTASDGNGGNASQSFTVTVSDVNDLPFFTTTPELDATEDQPYLYTAAANDIDAGDSVTLSAPTLPSWLTFTPATGELAATPTNDDVGSFPVVLRATDDRGGVTNQSFTVVVTGVNDAPVFVAPTPSGSLAGAEGTLLTFTIAATDVDGPTLDYAVVGLPTGATFDNVSGVMEWTPDFDSAGIRALTLIADDGVTQTTRPLELDIANTDRAPVMTAPASVSGDEGAALAFNVSAVDPDGDVVVLAMDSGPAGANFDPGTGSFSWTPSFDDAGTSTAVFSAVAGALGDTATVSLVIGNVNRAPVIGSTALLLATEDVPYTTDIDATDPDGDTVTYSFLASPAGALIDGSSGVITWTPTGNQLNDQAFSVQADDGQGGLDTQSFVVVVTEVNDAPVLTSTPVTAATEDTPYIYNAVATDPDDVNLVFSLVQGPAGMAIGASSGQLTFAPRNADVGPHPVEILVSDGRGGTDQQAFTVVVTNVNDAPVIANDPAPAPTVLQDQLFRFVAVVTDVDAGDSTTLTLESGPTEMTLVSGALEWTPGNADVGIHNVTLRATDQSDASDTLNFTVEVINLNDSPQFVSAPIVETISEGDTLVRVLDANDPDVGDVLTYSLVSAPANCSVTSDGVLSFTPDDAEVGSHAFFVRVEDQAGAFDELSVDVTVDGVNDAPVLTQIGSRQIPVGGTMEITLIATDPDSSPLTFTMANAPAGATLTDNQFSWATTVADAGAYTVTFTVSDGSLSDDEVVTLVVGDGGLPPSLSVPADQSAAEGELVSATVTAVDPQTSDAVDVVASGLPSGATFVDGNFDWTPGFDDAGTYAIAFSATNGSGLATRTWNLTITDDNRAPSITTIALPEAIEGTLYSFAVDAEDPDGDSLSFSLVEGPALMTIDAGTGTLDLLPVLADAGAQNVTVRVSDGQGGLATTSWTLVIRFIDVDADLLPDTWEVAVGTDPTVDDATEDPDGDGLSNLDEYLAGSDPFVSGAPTAPTLLEPFDLSRVETNTPSLRFGASTDPDDDALTYRLTVVAEDEPGTFVVDTLVDDVTDEGELELTDALDEDRSYIWTVTATDGFGFGVSESWEFTVDAENLPPPSPQLFAPADDATVAFAAPTLEAVRVEDPDGDQVRYTFTVRENAIDGPIVATSPTLDAPPTGTIVYALEQDFPTGTVLVWTVVASDPRGGVSAPAPAHRLTIDLVNLPPPPPQVLHPTDAPLTLADAEIRIEAVEDPEGQPVVYDLILSAGATFDPLTNQVVAGLTATDGEVTYDASALTPDGLWGLRVVAFDGVVSSQTNQVDFAVDFVDEAPSAPVLIAPDDNGEVESQPVAFLAAAGTDADGDALEHRLELLDPDTADVTETATMTPVGDDVEVSLGGFDAGERVSWRVVAVQVDGAHETESEIRTFRVAAQNERPQAPSFLSPIEGETRQSAGTALFIAALDPEGDSVTHDFEVLDIDGELVFSAALLTADVDGEVEVDLEGVTEPGEYTIRARGRDLLGAGAYAEVTFFLDPPPEVDGGVVDGGGAISEDAGPTPDGGVVDGGVEPIVDAGSVDGEVPIITDVGYDPVPLPSGCGGCAQTGPEASAFALLLAAIALIRRRRRRHR